MMFVYMKDTVVSYMLDPKNFSPAFLVVEEHVHYMNVCAIEIFTHLYYMADSNTRTNGMWNSLNNQSTSNHVGVIT